MRAPVKRKPVPKFDDENIPPTSMRDNVNKPIKESGRKIQALSDTTSRSRNLAPGKPVPIMSPHQKTEQVKTIDKEKRFGSGSYDRVKAFERLKQLERSRFLEEDDFDYDGEPNIETSMDIGKDELPEPKSPIGLRNSGEGISSRQDERTSDVSNLASFTCSSDLRISPSPVLIIA